MWHNAQSYFRPGAKGPKEVPKPPVQYYSPFGSWYNWGYPNWGYGGNYGGRSQASQASQANNWLTNLTNWIID